MGRWRTGGRRLLGLAVVLLLSACGARARMAQQYPQLMEHQGRRVDNVRFASTDPFRPDSLQRLILTQPSQCRFLGLPLCVPFTRIGREEHLLNIDRVHQDVQTLEQFYRVAGYFGTRVVPESQPDGNDVDITFRIERGDAIVLDALTITGTEELMSPDSVAQLLPLQPGDIFHLGEFVRSAELALRGLQRRGYAHAQVLRSFSVDTIDNRAEASIDILTGPRVVIDSIVVRGAPNVGRSAVLRQLEFNQGELLLLPELTESQRNLYSLEIVSLASITLAPDSLQVDADDQSRGTVLVSIVEAPLREVEAAVGFGTQECLRTDASWVHRSFGGGARRLALRGSLSRLGVGEPFAIGAGGRVCPRVEADSVFGGLLFDYRLSADYTEPYFLSPRSQFALAAYAERQSEPGVYQRRALGSRAAVTRRLGARSGASVSLEAERGVTRAQPALFCAAFLVCQPAVIDSLVQPRFRAELGANYVQDRTNAPLDPSAGHVARTGLSWAAPWLGSQVTFLRWTGDGSYYREVGARRVAAVSLRLGNFFGSATVDPRGNFLPPEERFFAGGASTVRGYARNALGPGVYVTDRSVVTEAGDTVADPERAPQFVPTGGTSVAIANLEMRLPSPFWTELLRLVAFVDAGAVGTGQLWQIDPEEVRFTPGVGARLQTPVGPVRFDVGFNPYRAATAPLLLSDPRTGRVFRVADEFQPADGNLFSRMRLHLGIGHAF